MIDKIAELKPCPFCGHRVGITEFTAKGGEPGEYSAKIQCRCGLTFEKEWLVSERYLTPGNEDIITAWNNRKG